MIPTSRLPSVSSWSVVIARRCESLSREPKPSSTNIVSSLTPPAEDWNSSEGPRASARDALKDSPPDRELTDALCRYNGRLRQDQVRLGISNLWNPDDESNHTDRLSFSVSDGLHARECDQSNSSGYRFPARSFLCRKDHRLLSPQAYLPTYSRYWRFFQGNLSRNSNKILIIYWESA